MTSAAFMAASTATVCSRSNDASMSGTPGFAACGLAIRVAKPQAAKTSHHLRHLIELDVMQMAIQSILAEQFLVNAGRLQLAVVQHEQPVAGTDRRDTVRQ